MFPLSICAVMQCGGVICFCTNATEAIYCTFIVFDIRVNVVLVGHHAPNCQRGKGLSELVIEHNT